MATAKQTAANKNAKQPTDRKASKKTTASTGRVTPPKALKTVSTAQSWKKTVFVELSVPSGNVCLAQRPGMQVFVKEGIIPNSLMPIVLGALDEGKAPSKRALQDIKMSPEMIEEMTDMYDAVALYVVKEPNILDKYKTNETDNYVLDDNDKKILLKTSERDNDALYVDEVDLSDKQFIFNWAVGGSSDLERFREEQAAVMESLQSSEDVGDETE